MGCVEHPLCHPFQQTQLSSVLAHTVLSIPVCQRSPDVGEMLVKEEGPVPPCKDLPVPRGAVYTLCQQKDRLTRSLCVKQGHSGTEKPPRRYELHQLPARRALLHPPTDGRGFCSNPLLEL